MPLPSEQQRISTIHRHRSIFNFKDFSKMQHPLMLQIGLQSQTMLKSGKWFGDKPQAIPKSRPDANSRTSSVMDREPCSEFRVECRPRSRAMKPGVSQSQAKPLHRGPSRVLQAVGCEFDQSTIKRSSAATRHRRPFEYHSLQPQNSRQDAVRAGSQALRQVRPHRNPHPEESHRISRDG